MLIPFGVFSAAGAGGGAAAGAYELISSTILTGSQASITFSNAGWTTYKHLQLRIISRSDRGSGTGDGIALRLNSDTATNYSWHYLEGNGSAAGSGASTSSTSIQIGSMPVASDTAGIFQANIVDILDFTSTTKNKTTRNLQGAVGANKQIWLSSGAWRSTSAVTSLNIFSTTSSNFVSGSRFSLYGIKG